MKLVFAALALAASLGALLLLWAGWRRGRITWSRRIAMAVLVILALISWIASAGAEIGIPLMLETSALLAFGFILTRIERRPARAIRARTVTEPPKSRARLLGAARFLVAGPLGLIAALGIAILIATRAPGAEQTRLILAGLLVPSIWATVIGWTVASHRLPLQSVILTALGAAGFGSVLLGGL